MKPGETPHPPATPEFGAVTPGGAAHAYETEGALAITKLSVGPFDNNVYVVRCAQTNNALLVDGAADAQRLLEEVRGVRLVGIVQTHGHPDHVQALPKLRKTLNVPVLAHPADASKMPVPTQPLADNQSLKVGTIEVSVLHTPGHTPGSLCFLAGRTLFSGDTLFPAGPGDTGGKPAAFRQIMESLDRLFALPDETRVCPGHGLDTTIGREREYVPVWRARGW